MINRQLRKSNVSKLATLVVRGSHSGRLSFRKNAGQFCEQEIFNL